MTGPSPAASAEAWRRRPAIALEHVRRAYGGVTAVDDVSLSVGANEFVTILGPSGSGKTTVLLMIAGFVRPDQGRVTIAGEDVTDLPPHYRNLGFVFQNYALFPHLTVYENVAFPLRVRGRRSGEIRERVHAVLERLALEGLEARKPSQLSGGQQQRVALARAMVFDPPVLLMDEPLAALDRKLRQRMQLEIKGLHRALGIPVVYVTHDQEEALVMSDRIAVMNRGRLEQVDAVDSLYDSPSTEFVAGFLGESNILKGRLEEVTGGCPRVLVDGRWSLHACGDEQSMPGTSVLLFFRPERVDLASGHLGLPEDPTVNSVSGHVQEAIHSGDVLRYLVRLETGSRVFVKTLNRGGGPRPGDPVRVRWLVADTRLIPRPHIGDGKTQSAMEELGT